MLHRGSASCRGRRQKCAVGTLLDVDVWMATFSSLPSVTFDAVLMFPVATSMPYCCVAMPVISCWKPIST
ncbi:catalase domain protein [Candidatus Erwinia dacicola]|uniref:Catalase domain protein n=1 Tax=Candidatus Erwinia dacicola TaxID=252393 RepID=A0A328TNW9_9GAMM|nr:catalase domain protein [Candidatus Erwinia dacicola]